MLFNSIEFAIFLIIVFFLYWFVIKNHLRIQNLLLLIASYFFYGWWNWRFLSLIITISLVDYMVGLGLSMQVNPKRRKLLLLTSILLNIGLLGFFKYYNFFIESFVEAFSVFGKRIDAHTLNIILPIGISFYAFKTLSYTIDVYKRKFEPTKDIIAYFAFVSFFPQLFAGPIEKAADLLPQFCTKRKFEYHKAVDGMRQILWGLFQKVVIADNCAQYANIIFKNYSDYSGSTLMLGAIFFTFQIYGDFSGYSDIAIGTSRLFGFNSMRNFAFPYFSRDIAEFWRRWHISLCTWFRDYVYIPLGGSRCGTLMKIRNTFIIFLLSGLWHGANWTFIAWGFINASYFLPLMLLKRNRKNLNIAAEGKIFPSIRELSQIGITFMLTTLAWIFFRAENMHQALFYLAGIFSPTIISIPRGISKIMLLILILAVFFSIEWLQRDKQHALQIDNIKTPRLVRWGLYYVVIFLIFWFGGIQQPFIYFQF